MTLDDAIEIAEKGGVWLRAKVDGGINRWPEVLTLYIDACHILAAEVRRYRVLQRTRTDTD